MPSRYQTIFRISGLGRVGPDLLEHVRSYIRGIVDEQFGTPLMDRPDDGVWENENGELRIESDRRDSFAYFTLIWRRLDEWEMRWRLATEGDDVEAEVQVLGPDNDRRTAGAPALLDDALHTYHCRIQGETPHPDVVTVTNENADWYAESLILGQERRIPVVAVSERLRGEPNDRIDRAINILRGVATVVTYSYVDSLPISAKFGRLACSGGEVRVYRPGATREDDPGLHRKWRPNEVDWGDIRDECMHILTLSRGPRLYHEVREEIVRLWEEDQPEESIGNLPSSAQISRLESELAEERAGRTRAEAERDDWQNKHAALEKASSDTERLDADSQGVDETINEVVIQSDSVGESLPRGRKHGQRKVESEHRKEIEKLNDKIEDLELTVQQKDTRIAQLQGLVSELSDDLAKYQQSPSTPEPIEAPIEEESPLEPVDQPKSVSEVVLNAQKLPGLRFLDSAFASANDSPYRYLDRLDKALGILSEYAEIQAAGQSLGMTAEEWFKQKGLDYVAHEGQQAMQKAGRYFTDTLNRTDIAMPEHIRLGGGGNRDPKDVLRIHFAWGKEENLLLVGHVGEHLPNART